MEETSVISPWVNLNLPDVILNNLNEVNFVKPTKIQELVIPAAIRDHLDILGAAETGSGKTMAFAIPMVCRLLEADLSIKHLRGLVLVPTRELAVQVRKQFDIVTKGTNIKVAQVTGGLSQQKQERILRSSPHIIIATPGRFWALVKIARIDGFLSTFEHIEMFVIDEIDRMVERGHFEELEHIVEGLKRDVNERRQTLVFSATLTFIHTAPKREGKKMAQLTTQDKIKQLVTLSGMKKNKKIIDITRVEGTAENLVESRMNCNSLLDKDTNVIYLLKRYPGRTLIFTNSVDASKRLYGILTKLKFNPIPCLLHAKMDQKARLKNLERFSEIENSILIATDVAARGLDIKGVEHVIHYQVPNTTELYIHRSGRTARAFSHGITVLMVDELCASKYHRIQKSLGRKEELPIFPIDSDELKEAIRARVELATESESLLHKVKKTTSKENWFKKAAREADIELDETIIDQEDLYNDKDYQIQLRRKNVDRALLRLLKEELPKVNDKNIKARVITPEIIKEYKNTQISTAIESFSKARKGDVDFKKKMHKLDHSTIRRINKNVKLKIKKKKK
ncbi:ATP-dependent RNA helicase DDX24 [Strongyloides ratti]|uniref:RNA helicase n=1 Tax=Strongyloides ratti TaxID=34506 RepID=A0A090MZB5_STRRB|nr:ATP-dependent RNA helicase DDX24 [Strongyloides ratti]CEF68644.1 ATP-dependent RNA helicase DDX24 [Strongyloides ratti]